MLCLMTRGRATKAELVADTGLSMSTVSSCINSLLKLTLLTTDGMEDSSGGRCSTIYSMKADYGCFIGLDVYFLNKHFKLNWKYTLRRILVMLIGLLGTAIVYLILYKIFGDLTRFGRIGMIPLVAVEGIIVLVVYGVITSIFNLPQKIFKINFNDIKRKLMRK